MKLFANYTNSSCRSINSARVCGECDYDSSREFAYLWLELAVEGPWDQEDKGEVA